MIEINRLREEQIEQKKKRKELARKAKNAIRKNQRLKGKAKQLSTGDLLTVLRLRAQSSDSGPAGSTDTPAEVKQTVTNQMWKPLQARTEKKCGKLGMSSRDE